MNIIKEKWDEIIHKLKIEYDVLDVSFKTWIYLRCCKRMHCKNLTKSLRIASVGPVGTPL